MTTAQVEISEPVSLHNEELLKRALITRIHVLEKQLEAAQEEARSTDAGLRTICRFLFPGPTDAPNLAEPFILTGPQPNQQSTVLANLILDELKRLGIGNGHTREAQ